MKKWRIFAYSEGKKGYAVEVMATEFTERGFQYRQVAREGRIALYSQQRLDAPWIRYEVVRLTIQKAHTWPTGVTTPEKEAYPPSTAWGVRGWTFSKLQDAQAHFHVLTQAQYR